MPVDTAALSASGRELAEAIQQWTAGVGADRVQVRALPIPADDDYGLELSLALRPLAPRACPVELGITRSRAGAATYLLLDSWSGIGRRFALGVGPARPVSSAWWSSPSE